MYIYISQSSIYYSCRKASQKKNRFKNMASKQQISFSLAFLAAAIILLAGQATARREILTEVDGAANPKIEIEMVINELISCTQRAKDKIPVLGNSQMVQACGKAYASSLDSLNKALGLLKGSGNVNAGDLIASITAALHAYESCDYAYAQANRPSPFNSNNANLKYLITLGLQLASNHPNNN